MIPKASLLLLLAVSSCFARQVVKIRVVNNAVLVPVRVNGRDLSFLLDTGSEHSAIDARGWLGYFGKCETPSVLAGLEQVASA